MTEYRKKLIEVALPLEAINRESAREKSIRHGHPSTLHLWWARRPLAACRAVLFASLVDDPSAHPDQFPTEEAQEEERQRLFRIIEDLVKWENSTNEDVLNAARAEILRSTDGNPPPVLDPFCGGGSIPLEAQRLGLEAHASDLNPVAVLITKALIEIPPKFAGMPPVNPESRANAQLKTWRGAQGLAEDVRYYGRWMRDEAEKRIGHLYPKVTLPAEYGGGEATVIAWLWARTVKCPNPACGAEMPLVRSFALSTKKGKEAWVEPIVDHEAKTVRFEVRTGNRVPPEGTKQRGKSRCLFCGADNVSDAQLREQASRHGLGSQLMAVVAEGQRGRVYVAPDQINENIATQVPEADWLAASMPDNPRWFSPPGYGLPTFRDLFTHRQLIALTTFSELVGDAHEEVLRAADAVLPSSAENTTAGTTASGYADAIATYLALARDKCADYSNTIATWASTGEFIRNCFARQAIPMTWDFAECGILGDATGSWPSAIEWVAKALDFLEDAGDAAGLVHQQDATNTVGGMAPPLISTDPPYYDNIGYADLSDFFYVWLRRSLRSIYPDLFKTLVAPKKQELIAAPYRFEGSRARAQEFFEQGLGAAFARMREAENPAYPVTVYYAFKQAEDDGRDGTGQVASTGWETMLSGLLHAGFAVVGTWPMRSERAVRSVAIGTNALASSVVLVCRPRESQAPLASRREFLSALKAELPDALRHLQHGNIAPVDLAQASIGPGMAIFSRYSKVLEADGSAMTVRTALALINQALDEVVAEQEGEFDSDTRWAITWFSEVGMNAGDYGRAELLSKAKDTSVAGMVEAGFLEAKAGKVRIKSRDELDPSWDPATDKRLTVWEMTQHLIRRLDDGEAAAAALVRQLGANAEVARDLAYRLYLICERKKWSQEGQAYNALVVAWPQIQQLAAQPAPAGPPQTSFEL